MDNHNHNSTARGCPTPSCQLFTTISVVQKIVHPLISGMDKLYRNISCGHKDVWVWLKRLGRYVHPGQHSGMKLDESKVCWIVDQKKKGEVTNSQIVKSGSLGPLMVIRN